MATDTESRITDTLLGLGFHKNEVVVYLDLLMHGVSSAYELAQRTSIHRSNVYDILRSLISRGVVRERLDNKKKLFIASDPSSLVSFINLQQKEVKSILPDLDHYYSRPKQDSFVRLCRDLSSIKQELLSVLSLKKPIFILCTPFSISELLGPGFVSTFHSERLKKKIPLSCLYVEPVTERIIEQNSHPFTSARYCEGKINLDISLLVCSDRVLFLFFSDRPISLLSVQHQSLADLIRLQFDSLWADSCDPSSS